MCAMSLTFEVTQKPILIYISQHHPQHFLEKIIHSLQSTINCPLFVVQSEEDLRTRLSLATHSGLIVESSLCSQSLLETIDSSALPTLVLLEKQEHLGLIESFEPTSPLLIDVIGIDAIESPLFHFRLQQLLRVHQQWSQLSQQNREYQLYFSLAQEGIWFARAAEPIPTSADPETQIAMMFQYGYFAYCNETFAKMYGYQSPAEIIGKPLRDFLIPDDPENHAFLEAFILSGYQLRDVLSHELDRQGRDKYFRNSLIGMIENDHLVGAWGTQLDVTEQQLLENQLRSSLKISQLLNELHSIILNAETLSYLYESTAKLLNEYLSGDYVGLLLKQPDTESQTALQCVAAVGIPEKFPPTLEQQLKTFWNFLFQQANVTVTSYHPHDEDLPETVRSVLQQLQIQALYVLPLWADQSSLGLCVVGYRDIRRIPFNIESNLQHIGHTLSAGIAHRQLQEQFRRQQEQWFRLVQNAPIAITRFLLKENRYEFANAEFERQAGCTLEEFEQLSDKELIEMIHPEDRQRVFQFYRQWSAQNFPGIQRLDYRIINRNGQELWLDTFLYAEFDAEGHPYAIVQLCSDITELRRAQQALQQSMEEDFRKTLQNLQGIVARLRKTPEGKIVYLLREGQLAGELTTEKVRGKSPEEVFDPEYAKIVYQAISSVFETGKPHTLEIHSQGRWLLAVNHPIQSPDGQTLEVVASVLDITQLKQYELELKASQQRYQQLLEMLPAGLMILEVQYAPQSGDSEGEEKANQYRVVRTELTYANPAFVQSTGYTMEEFKQIPSNEIIHSDDFETLWQRWGAWLDNPSDNSILTMSYRIRHKSGEYRWIELYAAKLPTADPLVFEVVEIGIDITDRKNAEQRLAYLASFPEQNIDPIIEIQPDGTVTYCNPAAQKQFPDLPKRRLEHPILKGLDNIKGELTRYIHRPFIREIKVNDKIYEERIFFIPETQGLRIYCYDVTLNRLSELRLREALQREQEFNQLRSRFIRLLSHEIRTPLTGILSSADIIHRYAHRLPEEQMNKLIESIIQRSRDLGKLMDDFSFYNSLYENQIRGQFTDTIETRDLTMHIRATFESIAKEKQQTLEIQTHNLPPTFQYNRPLLDYIFRTLLQNASQFSPPYSTIWCRVMATDDSLVIEVEDQGIGIPKDEIHEVFRPFFRGSNVGHIPGTGLGLALLKDFIELLHGKISIRSEENKGTIVRVELPLQPNNQRLHANGHQENDRSV